jgi:hypothetical protein
MDCFNFMSVQTKITHFFYYAEQVEFRKGFDDITLSEKSKEIVFLRKQIKTLEKLGYHYIGDTNSDSRANTDFRKKQIFIGKDKTVDEAVLSLAYEMTNAKNGKKLDKFYSQFENDRIPFRFRAVEYAKGILKIESEAVFARSLAAIKLKKETLIKNQTYLEIAKKNIHKPKAAARHIFEEMVKNGTVNSGRKKALDHYIEQYYEFTRENSLKFLHI